MTAILALFAGGGAKLFAILGAIAAAAVTVFYALFSAKKAGVAQQQNADLKQGAADNAAAQQAKAGVDALGDDAVQRELRAKYTRQP